MLSPFIRAEIGKNNDIFYFSHTKIEKMLHFSHFSPKKTFSRAHLLLYVMPSKVKHFKMEHIAFCTLSDSLQSS